MHRTRLGDLLVKYGASPDKIDAAMGEYYGRVAGRSGEFCLERGACTQDQLNRALAEQAVEREDFDEASRYTASMIEDTHKSILEHLDKAREQVASLVVTVGGSSK